MPEFISKRALEIAQLLLNNTFNGVTCLANQCFDEVTGYIYILYVNSLFRWICPDLNYRLALITFNVLPLLYYFQLLDLITFCKSLNDFYDADLTEPFLTNPQHYSTSTFPYRGHYSGDKGSETRKSQNLQKLSSEKILRRNSSFSSKILFNDLGIPNSARHETTIQTTKDRKFWTLRSGITVSPIHIFPEGILVELLQKRDRKTTTQNKQISYPYLSQRYFS